MALNPLSSLPKKALKINRALISLSDKSELQTLADVLVKMDVEIISTGGTAKILREMGIAVKDVSEITGFPECLDGRVKTLHPKVHGGILARTSHQPDVDAIKALDIEAIDLVAVNLYPFADTVASGKDDLATATEYIDIGGPTMIRAAAKNFAHVAILTNPSQYEDFVGEMAENEGKISFETRQKLATDAFRHTASYDAAIADYMIAKLELEQAPSLHIAVDKSQDLRYGENPHQKAAVYGKQVDYIEVLHGKQLSYNNFLDLDTALRLIMDFKEEQASCAIFKHTIPCGVGSGSSLLEAYRKAFATDKVSPFGGIVIFNQTLDLVAAKAVDEIFTELIIAPAFAKDALEFLKEKKNRRLIRFLPEKMKADRVEIRSIFGGFLRQERDLLEVSAADLKVVTEKTPTDQQVEDLLFAWKVVRHVKSNAIVYAKNGQTLGIGGGQTSRVDASKIAIQKAYEEEMDLSDCVIASDAFFPFADGVETAAKAGAKAVIQPGGSVRDEEVIEAANRLGLTMVFTGARHFRH